MTNALGAMLNVLFLISNGLFAFWFFFILVPLKSGENLLRNLAGMWLFLAFVRGFALLNPKPAPTLLIHEPLNTVLFAASGAVILLVFIILMFIDKYPFQSKANSANNFENNGNPQKGLKSTTSADEDIETLLQLSAREFEEKVVELYRKAGHEACRTGQTGDHGVDIVVQAKNGEKWVVQCKRWRGTIGEPIVRDFYGTIQHEKADKGTLITTGQFSKPAREWAKGKPITLYDGEHFLSVLQEAKAVDEQAHNTLAHPQSSV